MTYDLPGVLTVESDGPVRIVTVNRPDSVRVPTWPGCLARPPPA